MNLQSRLHILHLSYSLTVEKCHMPLLVLCFVIPGSIFVRLCNISTLKTIDMSGKAPLSCASNWSFCRYSWITTFWVLSPLTVLVSRTLLGLSWYSSIQKVPSMLCRVADDRSVLREGKGKGCRRETLVC